VVLLLYHVSFGGSGDKRCARNNLTEDGVMQPDEIENEGPNEQRSDPEPQPCWTAPRAKIYSIETTQHGPGNNAVGADGTIGACLS
jgi:hypothetical protein